MSKRNKVKGIPILPKETSKFTGSLVTIVIPVYNRFDLLAKCLASIHDAFVWNGVGVTYDIVLVDNASEKKDADAFYSQVKDDAIVIRNKANVGFPAACNQGAKRTRSPLIFLLNSDVILDPGSGVKLVQEMDNPDVGICGMKLVFGEAGVGLNEQIRPVGRLQHIGISLNIQGNAHHAFVGWDENHPKVMAQHDVWAVTGAAFMVRRSIWNKTNGLYEGYGLGCYEDLDLCMSAREMGYNITVVPQSRGIHYTGATAEFYKIAYPMQQNYFTFLQRWQGKLRWTDGDVL